MIPNPIRLFHITAIDNLTDICQSGALLCKDESVAKGLQYQNVAHSGAQGARASRPVPDPPGGTIHDFVPFYFAPRSPMLSAIESGLVGGCDYRQEDILHFEKNVSNVLRHRQKIVFYDLNATLLWSTPHVDVNEIPTSVDWNLITEQPRLDGYCKYFFNRPTSIRYVDRLERRMAEFLVKQSVPLDCITRIGVINQKQPERARGILQQNNVVLPVEVMTDWYFLGQ